LPFFRIFSIRISLFYLLPESHECSKGVLEGWFWWCLSNFRDRAKRFLLLHALRTYALAILRGVR